MPLSLTSILLLGVILVLFIRILHGSGRFWGFLAVAAVVVAALSQFSKRSSLETRGSGDSAEAHRSDFRFPFANPQLFQAFGVHSQKGVHLGVDLGPEEGDSRVFPIAEGTVVCSGWNGGVGQKCSQDAPVPRPQKGLGYFLVIEHRLPSDTTYGRVFSVYGHLASKPFFGDGDVVSNLDQPLGYMGDTGGAGGQPHLHVEIQNGDEWKSFTFGDSEHGFSYAPEEKFHADPWYGRYLDPMEFLQDRVIDDSP